MMWSIFAHIGELTLNREYSLSPGFANSRMANSRWNMRIHVLGLGLVASNLKVRGLEIWYGVFDMQTSKYGNSVLITSPKITSSLRAAGVPWTRFVTSAAMRGSSSTAMHFFAFSRILTVRFPEPGPT